MAHPPCARCGAYHAEHPPWPRGEISPPRSTSRILPAPHRTLPAGSAAAVRGARRDRSADDRHVPRRLPGRRGGPIHDRGHGAADADCDPRRSRHRPAPHRGVVGLLRPTPTIDRVVDPVCRGVGGDRRVVLDRGATAAALRAGPDRRGRDGAVPGHGPRPLQRLPDGELHLPPLPGGRCGPDPGADAGRPVPHLRQLADHLLGAGSLRCAAGGVGAGPGQGDPAPGATAPLRPAHPVGQLPGAALGPTLRRRGPSSAASSC